MSRPNQTTPLLIIVALVAIGPFTIDVYLPAMPTLQRFFDTEPEAVQLTLSMYILGFAVAQLFVGPLSDRFGRKPIILGGLGLYIAASIGCTLTSSIEGLSFFRVLQAAGGCTGPVLGRSMVRDIYGPIKSARVMSYVGSAMSLAPAIAPMIGGLILLRFGWSAIFIFLTCYGAACFVSYGVALPETLPEHRRQPFTLSNILRNYVQIIRHREWLGYTLCCAFVFSGLFSFLSLSSFVFIDYLGFSEKQFGLLFAFIVAGHFCGTLVGGRFGAKLSIQQLVRLGVLFSLCGGVVMLGIALASVHNVYVVIGPMMIYMIGMGIAVPQSMAGAIASFGEMAGSASGLLGFVQMSVGATVGALVGFVHDGSPVAMALGIGVCGMAAFASYCSLPRQAAKEVVG